jgi:hypothetical protein
MKKASNYRRHAAQCRALARAIEGEHKQQLLQMADHWEALAAEREDLLSRHPEIACADADETPASLLTSKAG